MNDPETCVKWTVLPPLVQLKNILLHFYKHCRSLFLNEFFNIPIQNLINISQHLDITLQNFVKIVICVWSVSINKCYTIIQIEKVELVSAEIWNFFVSMHIGDGKQGEREAQKPALEVHI